MRLDYPHTDALIRHQDSCKECSKMDIREVLDRKEELCEEGVKLLLESVKEYITRKGSNVGLA